jgi:hypothetical protein
MRRSAVIYIVILAILAGFYYYLNNRPQAAETANETPESTPAAIEYLFNAEDGLPIRVHIESKGGDVVEVARDAENAWALTLPIEAPADQGTVEAAVGQVSTIRILDRVPNLAKDAVGLDDPEFMITIQFTSDVERIVNVGVLTPTESGYYTNQQGDEEILIIGNSALDALIGLLTNPPYLVATETPPP